MENIKELSHIKTLISSLILIKDISKKTGQIKSKDVYFLNMIYTLIYKCNLELSGEELNCLIKLYKKVYYKSDYICKNNYEKVRHVNLKNTFEQLESSDCNQQESTNHKIYFWQQNSLTDRIEQVKLLITENFLNTKYYHSPEAFEQGRNLAYDSIGVICFLDDNSTTTNYEIKDQLGNVVTDAFRFYNSLAKKQTLIVSKNIYSFGEMFFKIKKL